MLALAAVDLGLTPLSVGTSVLVMLLALGMAIVAFRATKRRGNRALVVVASAFLIFSLKNAFSAYNVLAHERAGWPSVQHDAIELVLSLFDLAIITLLFVPLLRRRRDGPEHAPRGRS